MKELNLSYSSNPLSDLISDEVFETLHSKGLIHEKSVRDYIIKKKFNLIKGKNVTASQAIESLRLEYPYLQFDTIRKIIYQIQK
jgi:hypothetical protein